MRLVVAVGGNAILRQGDRGTIQEQIAHAGDILRHVAGVVADGHDVVLTHGNGPIVGNIVLRNEAARDRIPPMPLYIDGADSQGGIGFMLGSVLAGALRQAGVHRPVATLLTQVIVDPGDPAFGRPTKPIGPRFDASEAEDLARTDGWFFTEDTDDLYRRVVPSPRPLRIVEAPTIEMLCEAGTIVIACGGGGIPVIEDESGDLHGIDAVIDKDLASSLLGRRIDAEALIILMEADAVYAGWGTDDPRRLDRVTPDLLEDLLEQDEFDAGSMSPKVRAAVSFTRETGRPTIICQAEDLARALSGDAGTYVSPEAD